MKQFVIAGTHIQASLWIARRTSLGYNPNDYMILSNAAITKGLRNPRGWFIGTWYQREDIKDIFTALYIACDPDTPSKRALEEVARQLTEYETLHNIIPK